MRRAQPLRAQIVDTLRSRLPEDEVGVRPDRTREPRVDHLALRQAQPVDVDLVVVVVERRVELAGPAVDRVRVDAGVVVRFVPIDRR